MKLSHTDSSAYGKLLPTGVPTETPTVTGSEKELLEIKILLKKVLQELVKLNKKR